jgi:hypothetical protein
LPGITKLHLELHGWLHQEFNPNSGEKPNMALIFGLSYLFSCFMGVILSSIVIHQFGFFSMVADLPGVKDTLILKMVRW